MSSIFFLLSEMVNVKKQRMHGVKGSAPEKTRWDEMCN